MGVKCDQLVFTPISPLTFRVSGGTKILESHTLNNLIQSVEGPETHIPLGITYTVKKLRYKVNIIEERWTQNILAYDFTTAKRTKSSIFMLPMFGASRSLYLWSQLFMNCFIGEEDGTPVIQLLYRDSADPLFIDFENALNQFRTFKRQERPAKDFVLYTFAIPKRHLKTYDHFKNGEYSKLTLTYKHAILDFHGYEVDSLIGQVLFKTPTRKKALEQKIGILLPEDSELLSIIDLKDEIFNPKTYFNEQRLR
tara:strand:- start:24439 stop:25197 length:759 start_codon:yes stop_codon:yes gene_type:complete